MERHGKATFDGPFMRGNFIRGSSPVQAADPEKRTTEKISCALHTESVQQIFSVAHLSRNTAPATAPAPSPATPSRAAAPAAARAAASAPPSARRACPPASTGRSVPPASGNRSRPARTPRDPLAALHPTAAFVYLAAVIIFAMACFHPVYAALALAGSFATVAIVRGPARAARLLGGALVFGVLIALANMLFVAAGSTPLFTAFGRTCYLESLCYGATVGTAFVAMALWFSVYAAVMDAEATAALFGGLFPTVSLMTGQAMRLVPQFLRRGRDVADAVAATTAAGIRDKMPAGPGIAMSGGEPPATAAPGTLARPAARPGLLGRLFERASRTRSRLAGPVRTVTVLMAWGMEDGLVRSDAMRARGFGCGLPRTRYRRQRFAPRDAAFTALVVALAAVNAALAAVACGQFGFYPRMDRLVAWWGYAPYALLVALPALAALAEWSRWR